MPGLTVPMIARAAMTMDFELSGRTIPTAKSGFAPEIDVGRAEDRFSTTEAQNPARSIRRRRCSDASILIYDAITPIGHYVARISTDGRARKGADGGSEPANADLRILLSYSGFPPASRLASRTTALR